MKLLLLLIIIIDIKFFHEVLTLLFSFYFRGSWGQNVL